MTAVAVDSGEITKTRLLNIHQNKLRTGNYNIDHKQDLIIEAFGGIENTLSVVLSLEDFELNQYQLQQIHDTITIDDKIASTLNTKQRNKDLEDFNPRFTFSFQRNNTYLHKIIGENYGEKMFNIFIQSKVMMILYLICPVIFALSRKIAKESKTVGKAVEGITATIWIFMLFPMVMLSMNRNCAKLIAKSFEFWLKTFYIFQFIIARAVLDYYDSKAASYEKIIEIYGSLVSLTILIWISAIHGMQFPYKYQCFASFLTVCFYTVVFLQFYLTKGPGGKGFGRRGDGEHNDGVRNCRRYEDDVAIEFWIIHISLKDLRGNALIIIIIFFWKQFIMLLWKRNKFSIIKLSPYYSWIENPNNLASMVSKTGGNGLQQTQSDNTETDGNIVLEMEGNVDKDDHKEEDIDDSESSSDELNEKSSSDGDIQEAEEVP